MHGGHLIDMLAQDDSLEAGRLQLESSDSMLFLACIQACSQDPDPIASLHHNA